MIREYRKVRIMLGKAMVVSHWGVARDNVYGIHCSSCGSVSITIKASLRKRLANAEAKAHRCPGAEVK